MDINIVLQYPMDMGMNINFGNDKGMGEGTVKPVQYLPHCHSYFQR